MEETKITETQVKEVEITSENFDKYFKDVRTCKLEKGDVIARYSAVAEFVEGGEKRQIISLVRDTENKMEATVQVMRKLLFASEIDAYQIPKKIAEDLLSGMSEDDVAKKPYKYTIEMFFYTQPENIPKDDPHWSCISLVNLEDFNFKEFSHDQNKQINQKMKEAIKSNLLSDEENEKLNKELEEKSRKK